MESKMAMLINFSSRKRKKNGINLINKLAKNRCQIILKYTQPKQYHTILTLKKSNNEVAITIQLKKVLI